MNERVCVSFVPNVKFIPDEIITLDDDRWELIHPDDFEWFDKDRFDGVKHLVEVLSRGKPTHEKIIIWDFPDDLELDKADCPYRILAAYDCLAQRWETKDG